MRYRRFGKTNLNFSVFSLGTMRYLASEENAVLTVQKAISQGINHIETAQGYGKSEQYLGRAMPWQAANAIAIIKGQTLKTRCIIINNND